MPERFEPLRPYLEQLEVCIRSAFDMAVQLEEQQEKLEKQLNALREVITERDRRLSSLRASLDECRQHRLQTERDLEALKREKETLTEELGRLRAQNQALQERVQALERPRSQSPPQTTRRTRRWKW